MVAARLPEIDGRIDGAGGFWPNELSPAGNASGSLHEKRRVDDSGQDFVLRDGDAAADRRASADRGDSGRTPDQTGGQPASSGERRRDRCIRAGVAARSLRSGALETFRRERPARRERKEGRELRGARSRDVREISRAAPDEDRGGRRRGARVPRRGTAFADPRTFARRAAKDVSENAVVRLRSAPDRGA